MENSYRENVLELAMIYLGKNFEWTELDEFGVDQFTYFIFKQLFDIDINMTGYGLDDSTKQMTNDIGDLKIYNEFDPKKINYLVDINKGDLVFFHTKSLGDSVPSPGNKYPGHVGIYLGDEKFIHVSIEDERIVIDALVDKWLDILVASRDVIKNLI